MRRIRFGVLAIASFVAVLIATFLAPGTFLNRALSALICTVFSFNSTFCVASLAQSSNRVVAANPPAVEKRIPDISRYLQARDPSEFGDDKPATPPATNPQVPPFPQQPDPNTPLRPDFDNPVQNPPQPNSSVANTRGLFTPSLKELSPSKFELELVTAEGCKFITTIIKNEKQTYQESIRFIPSSIESCKLDAFTTRMQPDGNRIEIKMNNSRESLIIEKIDSNSIKKSYTDSNGKIVTNTVAIPDKLREVLNQRKIQSKHLYTANKEYSQLSADLCKIAKFGCDALGIVSGAVALAQVSAFVVGAAFPPVLIAEGLTALVANTVCFAMFGGVPPVFSAFGNLLKEGTAFWQIVDGISKGLDFGSGVEIPTLNTANKTDFNLGFDPKLPPFKTLREFLGCEPPDKNETQTATQPTPPPQTAQQPQQQQAKACQIPKEFWSSHKRQIGPVNMRETTCVVQGSVMTNQGMVDGQEWCGACSASGNNAFGQPPKKVLCSQPEDPARRNPVPACPDNWFGQ